MNLQKLSLTRLFSRRKGSADKGPERVKKVHIPAASFGLVPSPVRKQELAEDILGETSRAACQRAGAGMTAFVP